MRTKIFITIIALLSISYSVMGQRYYNIKTAGANLAFSKNEYGFNGTYEKLFGYNQNSVFAEFMPVYRFQGLDTQDYNANIIDLSLNIGYHRYIEKDVNWLPFAGVGVHVGYDFFLNKNKLPQTVIYSRKFGGQYGVFADLGCEYMMSKIGIVYTLRPSYSFVNKDFNLKFLVGFKFYLN